MKCCEVPARFQPSELLVADQVSRAVRVFGLDKPYPREVGLDRWADVISLAVQQDDPAPDSFVDQDNLYMFSCMPLNAGSRYNARSYH